MRIRKHAVILSLLLAVQAVGWTQGTRSVTVEMSYDDNAFHNYGGLSDYVTQVSLYLAKEFGKEQWRTRLYYDSNFNIFAEYSDRFSHYHQVGIAASRSLGGSGAVLSFGTNAALRRFGAVYDYGNYAQASSYLNFHVVPKSSVRLQAGYLIKYRDYGNLAEFTHLEHQAFSRVSLFLPTRTSILLYGRYGFKGYTTRTVATAIETGGANSGRGQGRHSGGTVTVYSQIQTPSASQVIGSVRLGQAIAAMTGLSLQYLRRVNLSDAARHSTLATEVWNYSTEDDLFDDPYGYESHEISVALTQIWRWQTTVNVGYDRYVKNYSVEALDLSGASLAEKRKDTQDLLWLKVSKRFSQKSVLRNFELYLDLNYLSNASNDPYFDYDNAVFSVGSGVAL